MSIKFPGINLIRKNVIVITMYIVKIAIMRRFMIHLILHKIYETNNKFSYFGKLRYDIHIIMLFKKVYK